jgi:hypothetical protein
LRPCMLQWGAYLCRGALQPTAHQIVGRREPKGMHGKPSECLATEIGIRHRSGDLYVVTFPKTGTTLLQFICHLIRCQGCESALDFEDIHQVAPHTSSAWFADQDLNADQCGLFRLFKTHRMIEEVAPCAAGVRFVATVRDPLSTLVSLYEHRLQRGRFASHPQSIKEYAFSKEWTTAHMDGCMGSIWDYYSSFWACRHASNFLLVPYEGLVSNKAEWIRVIAEFLGVGISDELREAVVNYTSKEWMLENVSKFDESWVAKRRVLTGRHHPTIPQEAPKVTSGHLERLCEIDDSIRNLHVKLWDEKIYPKSGLKSYSEMLRQLCHDHNAPVILI